MIHRDFVFVKAVKSVFRVFFGLCLSSCSGATICQKDVSLFLCVVPSSKVSCPCGERVSLDCLISSVDLLIYLFAKTTPS